MVLGIAVVNGSCTYVSGCGWEVNGIDYSPAFYLTIEACNSGCNNPIDCINPDLIDPNAACFALWDPVCGCDAVTYGNECEAINYGGVTSWTEGECSGGGSDCPEIFGAMQQTTGPCNWIFEVEGSGEGAEVNWDFGDGTGESAGHIADHHYAEDGDYIVTAAYSDLLCEGVVLSTVISVEGCGEVEDDCTIEFDYEFYDGYAIFEAYNYPENVELVWTYNNEVYATGTHIIEVLEPNPFPEDGVTICVGYESENCPEGVFACEWLGMEDECELELEGWFENNMGYFEAYEYPAEVNLIWSINGDVVAEGVNEYELMNADFPEGFHLCVWYHNDECGVVEACEWIGAAGGDCPDNINVIPPKWDFCTWAFEIDTVWMGAGNPPSWMEVGWDFGDGSVLSNEDFWSHHVYDTDGVYEVIVQYWDSNCPEGVELSVVIQVEGCGEVDCIDQDQIDNEFQCTEEWDPVCGCDDITYSNDCYAYYYGGVTSWVEGECTNSVSDINGNPSWSVFPVPTSDLVTFKGLYAGTHFLKIYDNQGRIVVEESVSNGETISLKELINGWYTMQIVGVESSAKRVVIQR
jgi:hypothetical protein